MEETIKIVLLVVLFCLVMAIIFVLPEVIPIIGYPIMACSGSILFLLVIGFIIFVVVSVCS